MKKQFIAIAPILFSLAFLNAWNAVAVHGDSKSYLITKQENRNRMPQTGLGNLLEPW